MYALPAAGVLSSAAAQQTGSADTRWRLWYREPAKRWLDALPVGNGRLGAMVFGGVAKERIALNEATVWSGSPNASSVNPTTREYLSEMRRLLFEGKYAEGNALCAKHLCGREDSYGTHLPLANLWIEQTTDTQSAGTTAGYRRSLDLETALARVDFATDGVQFSREIFASNPDDVIVLHITCNPPGRLSLDISIDSGDLPGEVLVRNVNTLVLMGSSWEKRHSDGRIGVDFQTWVHILAQGGRVMPGDAKLEVQNADSLMLLVTANTSYLGADLEELCEKQIESAARKNYELLRARHMADHRRLFGRVAIDLGGAEASVRPTDERLTAMQAGHNDPHLSALFFQYGRYLVIAGSRENSPLPMNLQGIWNDGLAARMVWTCDFHLDINTQQNYWPSEVCNLSECGEPLFKLIESISRAGRSTAREMYGADGWVCHVYTNAWGFTAPGVGLPWGPFVTGGVWIAYHLWEHYLFTRDREFLRNRAYPVLKSAAQFFLDYMVHDPDHGWLVTGPSISPENQFLSPDGKRCSVSMGPTCDRELVFALFTSCIEASKTLDVDSAFRENLEAAREELPPLQIGKHGQLQEWLHDFDEAEPNHRHTSHLIALYPLNQITPDKTPELAQAARVTIERRTGQKNWEDVEWSRANLINFFARLYDGDAAHKHLTGLLREDTDHNLLTFSRAGVAGARENIFAIDGNTAAAAGIAEMLLQSYDEIHFLPALPSAWPVGLITGLRARGGCEVSLRWSAGILTASAVKSSFGGRRKIRYQGRIITINLKPGIAVHMDGKPNVVTGKSAERIRADLDAKSASRAP